MEPFCGARASLVDPDFTPLYDPLSTRCLPVPFALPTAPHSQWTNALWNVQGTHSLPNAWSSQSSSPVCEGRACMQTQSKSSSIIIIADLSLDELQVKTSPLHQNLPWVSRSEIVLLIKCGPFWPLGGQAYANPWLATSTQGIIGTQTAPPTNAQEAAKIQPQPREQRPSAPPPNTINNNK